MQWTLRALPPSARTRTPFRPNISSVTLASMAPTSPEAPTLPGFAATPRAPEVTRQQSLDDLGTPLSQVTFVVVDLETTGGSPYTEAITEIGALKLCGGELLGRLETLVNPG